MTEDGYVVANTSVEMRCQEEVLYPECFPVIHEFDPQSPEWAQAARVGLLQTRLQGLLWARDQLATLEMTKADIRISEETVIPFMTFSRANQVELVQYLRDHLTREIKQLKQVIQQELAQIK